MKTRALITILLVAAVVGCGSNARPTSAGKTVGAGESTTAPSGEALPLWPKIKRGVLPNGLTYYILKHGKPEKRALLWLAVNAGSVQEDDDQRGLAHFVEHMAFNGTKRFPKNAIVSFLESIGIKFGPHLNAYTNVDETVYQLEVPTHDKTHLGTGLDILRDWAGDITFDPEEVEKERGVVTEDVRLRLGAEERLRRKANKVMLKGSRYPERDVFGVPEIIQKAPRDTLVRFYKDWYRPDLMAVIVVGDFEDPAAVEREIVTRFGSLKQPEKPRPRVVAGVPKADGTRVSIETDSEVTNRRIIVHNIVPHREESTKQAFRRLVAEDLYGAILNERFETLSRKKDTPFMGAGAAAQPLAREIDSFTRLAVIKDGRMEDGLRSLIAEVLRIEKHGVTKSELERARANVARAYDQNVVAQPTKHGSSLTSQIVRHFLEGELLIGAEAERALALEVLPAITTEELSSIVRQFGGADTRTIVLGGPDGKGLPNQRRVLEIIDEVTASAIEPWQEAATATTLMAQRPRPGKITKETRIESLAVTQWTLSNGVRVIVKPTDFEKDAVAIGGLSPGGLATATDQQFNRVRFAADVVTVGGVGELDAETLKRALAGKRVSVAAAIDDVTEGIHATGSARDLETMLQLVHLHMTAPRKDDQIVSVLRTNVVEALETQLRSPEVQFARQSEQVLWRGNARHMAPRPEDIKQLDLDQAFAFYKQRFGDATDFTFVIAGDVELATLKPLVETYLASLPANGRRERERDAGVRRVGGVVKKSWALGQEQKARVSFVFHGDEAWSRTKDDDMFILGRALSIRLRDLLRESMGGVYHVEVDGSIARSPHQERALEIEFGCGPESVDKLIAATLQELDAIASKGVTAADLEKVKQTFVRERETELRTNAFWVARLSSAARFGDDPAAVLDTSKLVARMTPDHVKAAARRFLDRKQMYQAVMLPAAKP